MKLRQLTSSIRAYLRDFHQEEDDGDPISSRSWPETVSSWAGVADRARDSALHFTAMLLPFGRRVVWEAPSVPVKLGWSFPAVTAEDYWVPEPEQAVAQAPTPVGFVEPSPDDLERIYRQILLPLLNGGERRRKSVKNRAVRDILKHADRASAHLAYGLAA